MGNAPSVGSSVFSNALNATVYYLPGTAGWGPTFCDRSTALWWLPHPVILALPPSFGVSSNGFGFTISWVTNADVVVEACTDLTAPAWAPVSTNTLLMGVDRFTDGWSYFSDPVWTNSPGRFYRVRSH